MNDERRSDYIRIEDKLDSHMHTEERRMDDQEHRLNRIEERLGKIETSIQGLLDAWNAANAVGNFLKWVAGIGAGILVLVEAIKHLGKGG